ncbi:MAG: nitrile hydratase accessory protein [Acidimicrobiales bacterium]
MADDRRERVEHLLVQLPHQEAIRPTDGEVAFETAWEIRAFALAVAAYEDGRYEWTEFQEALVDSIRRWEESGQPTPWRYYDRWLEALEEVLGRGGVVTATEVDERTAAVLTTPRDAHHQRAHREPVTIDSRR